MAVLHRPGTAAALIAEPLGGRVALFPKPAPHHETGPPAFRTGHRNRAPRPPAGIFLFSPLGPQPDEIARKIQSSRYHLGYRGDRRVINQENSALSSIRDWPV